jgi:nucleoside-diphosphate-sugar epimerase
MRVLITGSNGFVGVPMSHAFTECGWQVRAATRRSIAFPANAASDVVTVGEIGPVTRWSEALSGVDAVVHLAARVHVMQDTAPDPLAEFRRVNVDGTLNLARQAAAAGVKRLVFLSSIKVNGEQTAPDAPYSVRDVPAPLDAYGISKHEAEQGLRQICADTGLESVIIRPVLVYGPAVKGNFLSMLELLAKGIPLPFGAIHNARSLVSVENLAHLARTCVTHPRASGHTFLVSDGEDLSTTELLKRLGRALDRPARLLPIPVSWLTAGASLLRKGDVARRVLGSLQVDITDTRAILDWAPPQNVDEGLRIAARAFLHARKERRGA